MVNNMIIESDIEFRRNEDFVLEKLFEYICGTYEEHYSSERKDRDVFDDWDDMGIAKEAYLSNIIKYAKRFGKKDGYNKKDLMKVLHYTVLLMNEHMLIDMMDDKGEK